MVPQAGASLGEGVSGAGSKQRRLDLNGDVHRARPLLALRAEPLAEGVSPGGPQAVQKGLPLQSRGPSAVHTVVGGPPWETLRSGPGSPRACWPGGRGRQACSRGCLHSESEQLWALVTPGSTEARARLTVAEAAAPPAKGAPAGGREVAADKGGTCGPWPGASLN